MATLLAGTTDAAGGEAVTFVVMNPGDYATLNNTFNPDRADQPGAGSQFTMDTAGAVVLPNLVVSGVRFSPTTSVRRVRSYGINVSTRRCTCRRTPRSTSRASTRWCHLADGSKVFVVVGYDILSAKSSVVPRNRPSRRSVLTESFKCRFLSRARAKGFPCPEFSDPVGKSQQIFRPIALPFSLETASCWPAGDGIRLDGDVYGLQFLDPSPTFGTQ